MLYPRFVAFFFLFTLALDLSIIKNGTSLKRGRAVKIEQMTLSEQQINRLSQIIWQNLDLVGDKSELESDSIREFIQLFIDINMLNKSIEADKIENSLAGTIKEKIPGVELDLITPYTGKAFKLSMKYPRLIPDATNKNEYTISIYLLASRLKSISDSLGKDEIDLTKSTIDMDRLFESVKKSKPSKATESDKTEPKTETKAGEVKGEPKSDAKAEVKPEAKPESAPAAVAADTLGVN